MNATKGDLNRALKAMGYPPGARPTVREVKERYRSMALTSHPDRGGDGEAMAKAAQAYSVLKRHPCLACDGLGSLTVVQGFTPLRVTCRCRKGG